MKTLYLTMRDGTKLPLYRSGRPRHCRRGAGGRFIKSMSQAEMNAAMKQIEEKFYAVLGVPADMYKDPLQNPPKAMEAHETHYEKLENNAHKAVCKASIAMVEAQHGS